MEKDARQKEIRKQDETFVLLFVPYLAFSFGWVLLLSRFVVPEWFQPVLQDPVVFVLSSVFLAFGVDVMMWIQDDIKMKKREGRY